MNPLLVLAGMLAVTVNAQTNLIGMALIILSHNITTNYVTKNVGITCEEAGCTNQIDMEVSIEVTPKKPCALHRIWSSYQVDQCECVPGVYRTEKTKGCAYCHFKPVVLPKVKFDTYVLGITNKPLLNITTIIPLEGNEVGWSRYHGGTVITPAEEKEEDVK